MNFIQRLKNRFKKPSAKRLIVGSLAATLLISVLLIPDLALAAENASEVTTNMEAKIAALMTTLFQFLNMLLYPVLIVISALMDNEVLVGPEMEGKLLEIWGEIRNWVNIAFVLIMVGVALYNVLGIDGEGSNYALKSILPKIVIGLVAVNFSFLAGKLLIDATAVLTNAAYALPTQMIEWDKEKVEVEERLCAIPEETWDSEGNVSLESAPRPINQGSVLALVFCEKEEGEDPYYFTKKFNSFGASFFNNFGEHNIAATMMINMGLATDVNMIAKGGTIDGLAQLSFNALFSFTLFLMFGFAYIALAAVLLVRLVVLWISLALSPVVILLFVFPDLANVGGNELDIKGQFFKHLFAPLIIGVVFSVGFTMISVLQDSSSGSWMGALGGINFKSLGDTPNVDELVSTYGKDINNFQEILIAIGAIVIIWVGVFSAASQTVASGVTDTLKGAGEGMAKFIGGAPLYLQAVPIPGGKVSPMTLLELPSIFKRERKNKEDENLDKLAGAAGFQTNKLRSIARNTSDKIRDRKGTDPRADAKDIHDYLRNKGSFNSPEQLREILNEYAKSHPNKGVLQILEKTKDNQLKESLESRTGALHKAIFDEFEPTTADWETQALYESPTESAPPSTLTNMTPTGSTPEQKKRELLTQLKTVSGTPEALATTETKQSGILGRALDVLQTADEKVASELFTPDSSGTLKQAIENYKKLGEEERKKLMGGVLVENGQLKADSFIQAVTNYGPAQQPQGGAFQPAPSPAPQGQPAAPLGNPTPPTPEQPPIPPANP